MSERPPEDKVLQLEQPAPEIYKPDDDQLALHLAKHWQDKAAWFHGRWHVYGDGYWQPRDEREVNNNVRKWLRNWRQHGVQISQRRVKALVDMMSDETYRADRVINDAIRNQAHYINLENGSFNLQTGELEAHRPDLYFVNKLDFPYLDDADCPTWNKYLRKTMVFPDGTPDNSLRMLVEQAMAYSLTARTDMKASFWLVGVPDSGKSTLIAILRAIVGDMFATIDLNQLGRNDYMLAETIGKRVLAFTEATENTTISDADYKTLVGGQDEVYTNVKYRAGISFVPTGKVWWAMNGAPRITDRSGAMFNRIYPIPFQRAIPLDERDPQLIQKLRAERSGIFRSLMYAYDRFQRQGHFEHSTQSIEWRNEYRLRNDTEGTFMEEELELCPGERIQATELYQTYAGWCKRNGFTPKNITNVSQDWLRLGLEKKKNGGISTYYGAKLKYPTGVDG